MLFRKSLRLICVLIAAVILLAACSRDASTDSAAPKAATARRPPAANWDEMSKRPYDLTKPFSTRDSFAVDLRHRDLSKVDLSGRGEVLRDFALWNTHTTWSATLPAGFEPARYLELGRDPGLGVRELHRQGITGKGVRIAFLDQTLLLDHEEYRDRVESYQEIGRVAPMAEMHGAAVLSLLAGKTIGVAPEASVTYYAVQNVTEQKTITWANHAKVIHEILDQNAKLPVEKRIRVIGISLGYTSSMEGLPQIHEAVERAKKEGVFVLTVDVENDYKFKIGGLGRDPLADPNDAGAYTPGGLLATEFYAGSPFFKDTLWAPMDARTIASPTGVSDYEFSRLGGMSWVVPYLEGIYTLALQVKPDLTPDEFFQATMATGSFNTISRSGKEYKLGPIINPVALMETLKKK